MKLGFFFATIFIPVVGLLTACSLGTGGLFPVIKCLEHATVLVMTVGTHRALGFTVGTSLRVPTKVGMTVMPPIFSLLNLAPGRVSCLIHRTAILSISTRIIGAPASHMCSTRYSCTLTDVVMYVLGREW